MKSSNSVYLNSNMKSIENEEDNKNFYELTPNIKRGFIRKVYGILSTQLFTTFVLCTATLYNETLKNIVTNTNVFGICVIVSLASICSLQCYHQKYPWNMLILLLFTLSEGIIISRITLLYSENSHGNIVFEALCTTFVVFSSLTSIVFFVKKDFTFLENILCVGIISLITLSIFQFFMNSLILHVVIGWFGVVVFSGYILYDTSLLLTKLGPDDFILASVMLYLDILNLFLSILQLFGASRD